MGQNFFAPPTILSIANVVDVLLFFKICPKFHDSAIWRSGFKSSLFEHMVLFAIIVERITQKYT